MVGDGNNASISGETKMVKGQMKDKSPPHPHPAGSPSKVGITVLRRASTRPSGEPKRKKPETLKSRQGALVGPSRASEAAAGGQEAVLARLGSPEVVVGGATCRLWGEGVLSAATSEAQHTLSAGIMGKGCHLF